MAAATEQAAFGEDSQDADSRDSGISITSCGTEGTATVDFSKIEPHRLPLTDCSNFVAKVYNSSVSSSRSSSYYQFDTPTGRRQKSVFCSDSLDHSQYEKKTVVERTMENHRKRSSTSMSPSCSLLDRKRSRNLSLEAPQSDRICRYNGVLTKNDDPFGDEDEDEVFMAPPEQNNSDAAFTAPTPRPAASLWDLARTNTLVERQTSENSGNGSFHEKHPKPMRAMSVGVIDADAHLPSMLEVKYSLPGVERPQKASQAYRSISPITLLSEFQRLGESFHNIYVIIDCRYPYEFRGGHVKGAVNLYKRGEIKSAFFPEDGVGILNKRVPIFYCEYSQKRGPTMANAVRSIDRVRNELRYPHVEYPEMYLLDHGYKSLWNRRECRQICEPCNYVPMDHKHFTSQLKSARLERHRSNASVKPNGDLEVEEKWSMRTRSSVRRNSSVLSLQSKFSQSSSTLSTTSEMLMGGTRAYRDILSYIDHESGPKKSVSAFDMQSVGSEVDLDTALTDRKASSTSMASFTQDACVQLGLKVITPDFPLVSRPPQSTSTPPIGSSSYVPLGLGDQHLSTPRICLDFSSISDTE